VIKEPTKELEISSNLTADHLWFGPDQQTPLIMNRDLSPHCINSSKENHTSNIKQNVLDAACQLPTFLCKKKSSFHIFYLKNYVLVKKYLKVMY
jgi:hypothetical protein